MSNSKPMALLGHDVLVLDAQQLRSFASDFTDLDIRSRECERLVQESQQKRLDAVKARKCVKQMLESYRSAIEERYEILEESKALLRYLHSVCPNGFIQTRNPPDAE